VNTHPGLTSKYDKPKNIKNKHKASAQLANIRVKISYEICASQAFTEKMINAVAYFSNRQQ
jgi:hypothetical protein